MKIIPACIGNKTAIFIKPDGTYLPCCWASTNPDVRNHLGEELYAQLNIYKYSIDEILQSHAYKLIVEKMTSNNSYSFCKKVCAEDKVDEHFVMDGPYANDGLNISVQI